MSKNFFYKRTGHKPSDKYFKTMPLWCDSDLAIAALWGTTFGLVLGFFFGISL